MLNQSDKSFVEYIKIRVNSQFKIHERPDLTSHSILQLIAIIEKQALALEKCKEQRDAMAKTVSNYAEATTLEFRADVAIELFDKHLSEILGE